MARSAASAARKGLGICCRKCCFCCCSLLCEILKCICKFLIDGLLLIEGALKSFVIDPIFVQPFENHLERKRDQYTLSAEDTAIIDDYFVSHAVGDHVTIRQYCCIFVPSSFCPCCFFQRVHVPHHVFLSAWLSQGTIENRTLKNVLCMISCAFLAGVLRKWFPWVGSVLFALFLCGMLIAWPTLRLTVMLFVVSLFHEDGRKVLMGILHFYLLTAPIANIVHNSNSILYNVVCTVVRALKYLAEELERGLQPFINYLRTFNRGLSQLIRKIINIEEFAILVIGIRRNSSRVVHPFEADVIDDAGSRAYWEVEATCSVYWKVDSLRPRQAIGKAARQGKAAVRRRLDFIIMIFRLLSKIHVSVTLWLLYKVTMYVYRFSRDMAYENHYITAETEYRDMERKRQGLRGILPLETRELMLFADFNSPRLIWEEWKVAGGNLVSVGVAVINFVVAHFINVALFSAADVLWKLVDRDNITSSDPWSSFIATLHKDKHGPSSYRQCLIEPLGPDWDHFHQSAVYISMATVLAILSPYIIRLRPLIASLYLPSAASRRSEWLYHLLLRRREIGPFLAELAESAKRTIWNAPILWELTEAFECVRCLSVEGEYVLLFRCYRCERRNCNYCIHLNRDCGSCGALMPYSPLGLEQDLIETKLLPELRAQRALV